VSAAQPYVIVQVEGNIRANVAAAIEKALAEHTDRLHARASAAFTLWQERYNADPEGFAHDWPVRATYGDEAATYYLGLLRELHVSEADQ
jgi:hypothetical protein